MKQLFLLLSVMVLLAACSSKPSKPIAVLGDRTQLLKQLQQWQFSGKIGFISPEKKQTANIHWQHLTNAQTIKLTTFLGINVLSIESKNGVHQLTVEGKSYQSENLSELIYQLTGLILPVEALNSWLLALPYSNQDQLTLNPDNQLPSNLVSLVNNQRWTVSYQHYNNVQGILMPNKLVLNYQQFKIKLNINQWRLP